jgi:opacity protein-like surface antigen
LISASLGRGLPAAFVAGALLAAPCAASEDSLTGPPPDRLSPSPCEWTVSMWTGLGSASDSDLRTRQAGTAVVGSATDFGAFIFLGARIEAYPRTGGSLGRHLGVAVEINGLAGEADIETQPGLRAEEVALTAGVITPSVVFRLPGKLWEGYVGAGATVVWESRLTDASGFFIKNNDTDYEAPLGLALYAGLRRTYLRTWFLQIEARHQRGRSNFDLESPHTTIDIDWRLTQLVVGSGYRF